MTKRLRHQHCLAFLMRMAAPDAGKLACVFVLLSASVLVSFAFPLVMRYLIDVVLPSKDATLIVKIGALLAILYVVQVGMSFAANYLYALAAHGFVLRIRRCLYERLLHLRYTVAATVGTGDLAARIMDDVGRVQTFYMSVVLRVATSTLSLLMAFSLLLLLSRRLTLVAVMLVPIQFALYQSVARNAQNTARMAQHQNGIVLGDISESVRGMIDIKTLTAEAHRSVGFADAARRLGWLRVRLHLITSAASHGGTLLMSLGPLGVLCFGSLLILNNQFTIGSLVAFTTIVVRFYSPMDSFASVNVEYRSIVGAMERIWNLMEQLETETTWEPVHVSGPVRWGDIQFHDVTFRYSEETPPVFERLSFRIREGEHVAVVGGNGTGETTIARLVLGLIEPTSGQVSIGGVNVLRLPKGVLRQKIAYVTGEPYIFNATLRENTLIAQPDAADSLIATVLEDMGLLGSRDITLDTILGEGGLKLSAGQRQRLALARALLRNPEVLIFDEATSSLDVSFEKHLLAIVRERFGSKTVMFIAHRESSLAGVTRRISLDREDRSRLLPYR